MDSSRQYFIQFLIFSIETTIKQPKELEKKCEYIIIIAFYALKIWIQTLCASSITQCWVASLLLQHLSLSGFPSQHDNPPWHFMKITSGTALKTSKKRPKHWSGLQAPQIPVWSTCRGCSRQLSHQSITMPFYVSFNNGYVWILPACREKSCHFLTYYRDVLGK